MLNKKNILVKEVQIPLSKMPILKENSLLKEALEQMSKKKYGICFCVKNNGKLLGILTDGDIRRNLLDIQKPFSALLNDDIIRHINKKPLKVKPEQKLYSAIKLMEKKLIWDLPVVDKKNKLIGMLHLHPIVKILQKK
tara:strand:+ start:15448 stop:15861 length:414 start_codon:yes stop_codon:yes gene_type:complete